MLMKKRVKSRTEGFFVFKYFVEDCLVCKLRLRTAQVVFVLFKSSQQAVSFCLICTVIQYKGHCQTISFWS